MVKNFWVTVAQFIKPIESMGKGNRDCTFWKNCARFLVHFDLEDGSVWPCSVFHGEEAFYYGDFRKENLVRILKNHIRDNLKKRWEVLSKTECKNCEFASWCYGGCGYMGYRYYGDYFRKDYFCEAYKMIFNHVYEKIKASLRK